MRWSDDTGRFDVTLRGSITFTDDLSDVQTLSDGGRLTIRDTSRIVPHTIEVRSSNGTLTHTYDVAGLSRPWDDEARRRLAEMIVRLVRHSGLAAESRVKSIFAKKGVAGVLDEIALLTGDYARHRYYVTLVDVAALDAAAVTPILAQVGQRFTSDYDRGQVLQHIAKRVPLDRRAAAAYVQAVAPTKSDYDRRRTLEALLAARPLPPGAVDLAVRSTADMRSDYDRSEVLRAALQTGPIDRSEGLFAGVERMTSSYEKRRVLSEAIDRGAVSADTKKALLSAAASISSDYDRRLVLQQYVKKFGVEAGTTDAFFVAVNRISSNYDRAEVLLSCVEAGAVGGANRDAFVAAAQRIQSTHDQNRVLAALVRAQGK
jgi:hypothetical protein